MQSLCARYDIIKGTWTSDILLAVEAGEVSVTNSVGVIDDDGTIHAVYALQNLKEQSVLCMVSKVIRHEIEFADAFYVDEVIAGENLDIFVAVTNTGDSLIEALKFEFFGLTFDIALDSPIKINEKRNITFNLMLPNILQKTYDIVVHALVDGIVVASDTYSLAVLVSDITINESRSIINGKQVFSLSVQNSVSIDEDVTLNIYVNGILFDTKCFLLVGTERYNLDYSFDEVYKDDYIYFELVSSISNMVFDGGGLSSLQDEKIFNVNNELLNYRKWMDTAKSFI